MKPTPALTIWEPWASLCADGHKPVENRGWSTPYRGPLFIHAGRTRDEKEFTAARLTYWGPGPLAPENRWPYPPGMDAPFAYGGIIGICNLVDVVTRHKSRWHVPGKFGWVLEKPHRLPFVRMAGRQRLWTPPAEIEAKLRLILAKEGLANVYPNAA